MKTIFITGASAGLGKATVKLFQSKGWKVIATMRNPAKETALSQLENVTLLPMDVTSKVQVNYAGHTLLFHPDFIRNYPLAKTIKAYGFFSYSVSEALYLSDKEKTVIDTVFENIGQELSMPIDNFSQDVLVSQIELLLNYSNRFYNRQFITRKAVHSDLLAQMEQLLNDYFNNHEALMKGPPSVQYITGKLHVSPRYLSDMLRQLTGLNTQQHIQQKLIDKAKEILSTTSLSVSEVAYMLGFEHSQSFNKIFKRKTNVSPGEFRESFN